MPAVTLSPTRRGVAARPGIPIIIQQEGGAGAGLRAALTPSPKKLPATGKVVPPWEVSESHWRFLQVSPDGITAAWKGPKVLPPAPPRMGMPSVPRRLAVPLGHVPGYQRMHRRAQEASIETISMGASPIREMLQEARNIEAAFQHHTDTQAAEMAKRVEAGGRPPPPPTQPPAIAVSPERHPKSVPSLPPNKITPPKPPTTPKIPTSARSPPKGPPPSSPPTNKEVKSREGTPLPPKRGGSGSSTHLSDTNTSSGSLRSALAVPGSFRRGTPADDGHYSSGTLSVSSSASSISRSPRGSRRAWNRGKGRKQFTEGPEDPFQAKIQWAMREFRDSDEGDPMEEEDEMKRDRQRLKLHKRYATLHSMDSVRLATDLPPDLRYLSSLAEGPQPDTVMIEVGGSLPHSLPHLVAPLLRAAAPLRLQSGRGGRGGGHRKKQYLWYMTPQGINRKARQMPVVVEPEVDSRGPPSERDTSLLLVPSKSSLEVDDGTAPPTGEHSSDKDDDSLSGSDSTAVETTPSDDESEPQEAPVHPVGRCVNVQQLRLQDAAMLSELQRQQKVAVDLLRARGML